MPIDLEHSRLTAGSETVVYNELALRAKKSRYATWVIVMPYGSMYETLVSARPLQSEGWSSQSRDIAFRLASALADTCDAESESPRQIRMTSPRQLGAARMDPWTAKNERRLRLIEKKHAQGLSEQESLELERLKREIYEHVQAVDPRPTDVLDQIDSRLDSLKKRLEAKRARKLDTPAADELPH
jgi:hypothetical protein